MYALVKMAGKQFKVSTNQVLRVPLIGQAVGETVEFDQVMAVGEGADMKLGTPYVDGASVKAEIVGHGRERTIRVFKKKRRKKYRRTQGHRQPYTEIRITGIA
ncbi:MAG: 50S ribosomal protein L21 [Candidatus Krumholzibacteriia bacterium]|nr:50S ribosomal protein L21 [bacterium]MCB9513224.1 50S ribosomal protein L21 [Candidatus Latescibacterota bacterium]MCB9514688.1 50S ribosomal protein L21 [Candidatus Latescibacterota bacterium]